MSHPTWQQALAIGAAVVALLILVFAGEQYLSGPPLLPGDTGHPTSLGVGG